jgi:hypothetical protein
MKTFTSKSPNLGVKLPGGLGKAQFRWGKWTPENEAQEAAMRSMLPRLAEFSVAEVGADPVVIKPVSAPVAPDAHSESAEELTEADKRDAVARVLAGESVGDVAREIGERPQTLGIWVRTYRDELEQGG